MLELNAGGGVNKTRGGIKEMGGGIKGMGGGYNGFLSLSKPVQFYCLNDAHYCVRSWILFRGAIDVQIP